jgi:hypothetical protein
MNKERKRFLAIVVAVGVIAMSMASSTFGQGTKVTPEQMERRAQQIKNWVQTDAKAHPNWRMLIIFRDGTQAAGRIQEVHENDFVLKQDDGFPARTIGYSEIDMPPQHLTPMAEKIAEYTGCTILVAVFFPLMLLMLLTGGD